MAIVRSPKRLKACSLTFLLSGFARAKFLQIPRYPAKVPAENAGHTRIMRLPYVAGILEGIPTKSIYNDNARR